MTQDGRSVGELGDATDIGVHDEHSDKLLRISGLVQYGSAFVRGLAQWSHVIVSFRDRELRSASVGLGEWRHGESPENGVSFL
jgi:hypothetical protein